MTEITSACGVSYKAVPWDAGHHDEISACWQRVLAKIPEVTVFHYPEWTMLACLSGAEKPWRVLIIKRGEEPLAIIPLKKKTLWTAEIIGEFKYENPPLLIDPAAEEEVWACLAKWIRDQPGVGLLYLGRYCDSEWLERFRQAMQQHGATAYIAPVTSVITIPLAEHWEQYLETLGHRTRANIRRLERQFAQEIPDGSFEVVRTVPAGDEALIDLIGIYRRRWRQRVAGSDLDRSVKASYFQEVFRWAIQQGVGAIPVVRIGGKIVAALTLCRIPGHETMFVNTFARELNISLPKHFSLGILLCVKTIRWAIDQGIRSMGMSYGSTEYKQLLGGRDRECWEAYLARSPLQRKIFYRINSAQYYLSRPPLYARYIIRRLGDLRREKKRGECDE